MSNKDIHEMKYKTPYPTAIRLRVLSKLLLF